MREATIDETPMGNKWRSTPTNDILELAFAFPVAAAKAADPEGAEDDFCIFCCRL
jgi:hypothetical protein